MSPGEIDFAALFDVTPTPYLVLAPDLVIVAVNRAYLHATGRSRGDLLGRYLFDAFPDNPADQDADGVRNLSASLGRVLSTREPDTMALQKYDIPVSGRPGAFEERWWSPVNTPVLGPDDTVTWIIHRVEDVTAFVRAHHSGIRPGPALDGPEDAMAAELYARGRELQRLNEQLRQAHARERGVAVALQEAMLRSPDLQRHPDIAVRYLPAIDSLNVCGDWYDIVDLPGSRFTVAVGDVVGHGLEAAAVMGMLRAALSTAIRADEGPARALDLLGLYARSVQEALATTAVSCLIDPRRPTITYSSAGHLPPVLLRIDRTVELLDQATDPPLGARHQESPHPQAELPHQPGDTLVLYTDGLIERPREDIDTGLTRLATALKRYRRFAPQQLADALLDDFDVSGGARDDIALVIIRL